MPSIYETSFAAKGLSEKIQALIDEADQFGVIIQSMVRSKRKSFNRNVEIQPKRTL